MTQNDYKMLLSDILKALDDKDFLTFLFDSNNENIFQNSIDNLTELLLIYKLERKNGKTNK